MQCDIGNATKKFFDMMHEPPFKLLLFCCACPDITPNMADISRYWNIWQVRAHVLTSHFYFFPVRASAAACLCGC